MDSTYDLAWYSFPKVDKKAIRNANSPNSPIECTDYSAFLPTIIVWYQLALAFHCYFVIVCLIFAIENVYVMLEYAYFMDLHFGACFKHEGFGLIVVLWNIGLGTGSWSGWRIRFVLDDRDWDSVSMLAGGFRVVPIIICLPQKEAQAITTWWICIKCTNGANVQADLLFRSNSWHRKTAEGMSCIYCIMYGISKSFNFKLSALVCAG